MQNRIPNTEPVTEQQRPADLEPAVCVFGEGIGPFKNPTDQFDEPTGQFGEMPNEASAEPASKRLSVQEHLMEGSWKETNLSADREPMMTREEVAERWGVPYGSLLAKIVLPYIPKMHLSKEEESRRAAAHAILVFDARENPHAPPHYVLASNAAVSQIAVEPARTRRLWRAVNRDIIDIREGDTLPVGRGTRWLPRSVRREQANSEGPRVISDHQATFWLNGNGELLVSSEGYNALRLIARPTEAEQTIRRAKAEREANYQQQILAGRAARAVLDTHVVTDPPTDRLTATLRPRMPHDRTPVISAK